MLRMYVGSRVFGALLQVGVVVWKENGGTMGKINQAGVHGKTVEVGCIWVLWDCNQKVLPGILIAQRFT